MAQKLVLLEDDKKLAKEIKQFLSNHDFNCVEIYDGKELADTYSTLGAELFILDINVPGMTGIEVCKHIRQAGVNTPILMLTALGEVDDRVNALESGADDFFTAEGVFIAVTAVDKLQAVEEYFRSKNVIAEKGTLDRKAISAIVFNDKNKLEKLNAIIDGAQKLGFLVTALLVLISVIITFNTIRLTIFISKEEIGVMRLVGASKMGVRGPFLIEGVIYGIIATIVTLVIFWPATAWLGRNMSGFLGLNVYEYYVSNIFYILLLVLSSGIILGVVSSFLAIRKYLNK